jgi:uroporphyrinogen-III synthase
MTRMVQVAVAGDVTEAEELESMLRSAGIETQLEPAIEHHPREVEDAPQKILVPESSLEEAIHAIESLSEPEDIVDA